MNSFPNSPTSLRRTLQYAEWTLLLMVTLLHAINQYFYNIQVVPDLFFKAVAFNLIFFGLSFIFPLERPVWQRRVYIAIELVLVLIAQLFWLELDILLYLFLIKSCFLLSRREVLFTVAIAGAGYAFTVVSTLPLIAQWAIEAIRSQAWEDLYQPRVMVLQALIQYVGISLFVIMFGFVTVSERKSRLRAQALTQEVESLAAALERSRIARDIHDSLGHSLTTLNIQLELAQEMRQRDPSHASHALNNAQLLASQCLEDVRQAVQTARQPDFDLTAALKTLIEQVKQNQALTIQTDLCLPPLAPPSSHQLYCVVQEGLTNIQKHAHASCVKLRGYTITGQIILELEDNGQGFNPALPHPGYGLRGMAERINLLGGQLRIKSAAGQGTQIQVSAPF